MGQSDLSELLRRGCETIGQGYQKEGQDRDRYIELMHIGTFRNLFNSLDTHYHLRKVLGTGRKRKDIKINSVWPEPIENKIWNMKLSDVKQLDPSYPGSKV